jgi:predicted PurR-regulated permease PerM
MTTEQTVRNTLIVIITLVAAYAIYRSIHILVVLLIAIILASAVHPAVVWLTRHKISQGLSILLVYLGLGFLLFVLSALVIPPITSRLADYISNDQRLASRIIDTQTWAEDNLTQLLGTPVKLFDPEAIKKTVANTVGQVIAALPSIAGEFGSVLGDTILVIVMGIYWLTERDQAIAFVLSLFPLGRRATIDLIIRETELSLSIYLRGVILVASFVGFANFCILSLLHVPDALMLGFIMGVTTILPIIGGYIGAGVSTLLALLTSPINGLFAFGSFVAVQQIENHYLTPRVMSQSVGLDPILVIVSLFIGTELGGVVGGLIAVPIAGTVYILLRYLVIDPRKVEAAPLKVEGGVLLEIKKDQAPKNGEILVEPR